MKSLDKMTVDELQDIKNKIQDYLNLAYAKEKKDPWKQNPEIQNLLEDFLRICKRKPIKFNKTIPVQVDFIIDMEDFPDATYQFKFHGDILTLCNLINEEDSYLENKDTKRLFPEAAEEFKKARKEALELDKKIEATSNQLKIASYKVYDYFWDVLYKNIRVR